jgi:hypothetical protein
MKKLVVVGFVVALSSPALAEEPALEAPKSVLGVDAAVVVPLGDYGKVATLAGGAMARAEFPVGRGYVFGRAGVLMHMLEDGFEGSMTFVPIYGGYRYPIDLDSGLYVAGEVGVTLGFFEADTQFGTASDSDSELGVMLSAGMRRGKLDLRGGLFLPDTDDLMGLMASLGYDFATF